MLPIKPKVICKDGTTLSVQASESHYCTPRSDEGPHTEVEVGYISDTKGQSVTPPETWKEYADGDFPSAVYGYVPVSLVEEFIEAHGGRSECPAQDSSGVK